jgi:N-acetylglucosamine-6-phosphate deacetylase
MTPGEVVLQPLFDPQVNGFAGIDFQQDGLAAEQLLSAVHALRRHGCAGILLTLITDEWPRLMRRLQHIKRLRDGHPELREAIAGWHIEGPFLSAEDGYRGAHDPSLMIDPTVDHMRSLRELTGGDPVMVTLAPERGGALRAIEAAVASGMVVSLGHTNASSQALSDAVRAGARAFTHLGNGCPRTLDRQDNILWRALNRPELMKGMIPDGIHVSPDLLRIVCGIKGADLYFTTDSMAAAGAPPGEYTIGKVRIHVGGDGVVRLPGQPYFAGSALTPLQGAIRARQMLGDFAWERWHAARTLMKLPDAPRTKEGATCLKLKLNDAGEIESGALLLRGVATELCIEPRVR